MSMPALALRLATVFALRGKTWAGSSVFDQPVNPIEGMAKRSAPVIAVYSGDEIVKVESRDWLAGDRSLSLVVQIYLPPDLAIPDGPRIDALRDGGELALNLIWRQIESVLLKDTSPWSVLWRNLVYTVHEVSSRPYLIDIEKGARLVARETIFSLDTIAAPQFAAPSDLWSDLLNLMEAQPELQPLAALVTESIRAGDALADWASVTSVLGLRDSAGAALGLSPSVLDDDGNPVTLSEISVAGLTSTPVVIDEP